MSGYVSRAPLWKRRLERELAKSPDLYRRRRRNKEERELQIRAVRSLKKCSLSSRCKKVVL